MFIIWRGLGWLVPIVVILCLVAFNYSLDLLIAENYYKKFAWPKAAAIIFSSVLVGGLGIFLNSIKPSISSLTKEDIIAILNKRSRGNNYSTAVKKPRISNSKVSDYIFVYLALPKNDQRKNHTLFFIPIEYWSFLLFIFFFSILGDEWIKLRSFEVFLLILFLFISLFFMLLINSWLCTRMLNKRVS